MANVRNAIALSGDHESGCALSRGGTVACWQGFDASTSVAMEVPLAEPAVQVVAHGLTGCARLASGRVQCWGDFDEAQLVRPNERTALVRGIADATDVFVESGSACIVRRAHPTWCSMPDDTLGTSRMLAAVPPGSTMVSLGELAWDGGGLLCFADAKRRVSCLGARLFPDDPLTPHAIANAGVPAAIHAGPDGACVLRTDHTIACFGAWAKGQLGDGATSVTETPVPVR